MSTRPALSLGFLFIATIAPSLAAQDAGPGTGGLVALAQQEVALSNPYRVLIIGAHPDDEDTELITILSRGYGAETAYLSLTRGEGGQNLVGGELGAALGVVRASELVASRSIDGASQFFTRAIDFGYSKTPEEAFRFWPRDSLLKDVVRIIRRFRPHVVISVWSGTSRDGHGHHQASGIIAGEAFPLAGDPEVFPELETEEGLAPWTPAKFYRNRGVPAEVILDGGRLDPATGLSLHQIAMRARSRHRSQDMGRLEDLGPSETGIALERLADGIEAGPLDSIFVGIPTPTDGARQEWLRGAILTSQRGVVVDAFVDDDEVVAGQWSRSTVVASNMGVDSVWVHFTSLGGADVALYSDTMEGGCWERVVVAPGDEYRCVGLVQYSPELQPSQPYFLRSSPVGWLYGWQGPAVTWGDPFEPAWRVRAGLDWIEGGHADVTVDVTARSLDQGLGEVRRPVSVVPQIAVGLSPASMLWPASVSSREFSVTAEYLGQDTTEAEVRLVVPEGWQVDQPVRVGFTREGERRTLRFVVTAPEDAPSGAVEFSAEAVIGRDTLRQSIRRIDYPHIIPRVILEAAETRVVVAPVEFPFDRRIGYLRGAADAIPEALAAAGVEFRLLTAEDLEGATVDSLDVIVIGPRAYEIDDAVRRAHPRLIDFARSGGTLITQYQQYQYVAGGFPPFPFTISRPHGRVTDETAPVTLLPAADLISGPNRITESDFDGWVQERGLYFAEDWDPAWTPVLEMHDVGEVERQGSLLIARLGTGTVVYTGLSFFRELPAAVPGAWRLFANLLALRGVE